LQAYLEIIHERPLHARAAHDNLGSLRVLEKCGFQRVGTDRYFANARGREIEEVILRLDADSMEIMT
jgi:RimJ/RimL family protein N-acetyltransferase